MDNFEITSELVTRLGVSCRGPAGPGPALMRRHCDHQLPEAVKVTRDSDPDGSLSARLGTQIRTVRASLLPSRVKLGLKSETRNRTPSHCTAVNVRVRA